MSCCCNDPVYIGCVGHCDPSPVLTAKMAGTHTVTFDFLEARYYFTLVLEVGERFAFPNVFNEYSRPTFTITGPDGNPVSYLESELNDLGIYTELEGPYSCFQMDIKPLYLVSGDVPAVTAPSCYMKLQPVTPERWDLVSGNTITVTNFSFTEAVSYDVFLDGRLVSEVAGDADTIGYSISGQDVIFSEDVTGSEVVVKAIIEVEYDC